jgi:glycosyltransferase involved in cell wall biosynthesis
MRVLLLGPYPPPHGGVQTNLVAIREYLRSRGVPCHVINLTRYRQADHDGVFFPKSALALIARMLRLRFSIIHLHIGGDISPRLQALGLLCCLWPKAKAVVTLHSGGYPASPAGLSSHPGTLRAFVMRRFDRLIAVNESLRRFLIDRFAAAEARVRFILPYTLPAAVPQIPLPEAVQRFFAAHSPVLLSMGWFETEYDFPLQIEALGRILSRYPRAGLLLFGQGRLEAELRARAAATSYADRVLLPGDVSHEVALASIARADVFLRTSHYDGDSISVREALHFGTPVIASDCAVRPPGVRLIPGRDLDALAAAIEQQLAEGKPPAPPLSSHLDNIEAVYRLYEEL